MFLGNVENVLLLRLIMLDDLLITLHLVINETLRFQIVTESWNCSHLISIQSGCVIHVLTLIA